MENENTPPLISIDDFSKIDIRMGHILSAEFVPDADKLIRFMVDVGEGTPRQILSGIREHYPDPDKLVGLFVPVIVNLAPRTIRGFESNGMILYAVGEGEAFSALAPVRPVAPGTVVR